jgi:acyl-coenzyme A synthetase/AMP-(fatty) acid ligase
VQYWKNFLRKKQIKKIMLLQHCTLDCIAIVFACAEVGVTIHTITHNQKSMETMSQLVDFIIVGPNYVSWIDTNTHTHYHGKELHVLDEKNIDQLSAQQPCRYQPDIFDSNHILIVGASSGSTGPAKLIKHTNQTFISAGRMSHHLFEKGDTFASWSSINHIGFLAVTMIAPLFVGVTIFTLNYIYEMMVFSSRGFLTRLALYETALIWTEKHSEFRLPPNCLKNCSIITAGGPTSEKFVDTIFNLGAKKFTNFYGCNETLSPFFTLTLHSATDEFFDGRVGQPSPEVSYKIVDDQLYVKTPSLSPELILDNDGYYNTGDYAAKKNNQVIYLGRKLIQLGDKKIFSKDINDQIQMSLADQPLYFADYQVEYDNIDCVNIYAATNYGFVALHSNIAEISTRLKNLFHNPNLKLVLFEIDETFRTKVIGKITLDQMKQHILRKVNQ